MLLKYLKDLFGRSAQSAKIFGIFEKTSHWVSVVRGLGCGHDASFFLSQTLSSGLLLTVGREYFTRLFVHCSDLSLEINYSQVDPKEI